MSAGFVRTAAVAVAGGAFMRAIDGPLPWMIGPLVACAAVRMVGDDLRLPAPVRNFGLWTIGTVLGLYFSPDVVAHVLTLLPWVILAVLWALLLGLSYAWVIRRYTGATPTTAFFAGAIGGASEMALQGERLGARVDQIAAFHSVRILVVVVCLPWAYRLLSLQGSDPYLPAARSFEPTGFLALGLITAAAALLWKRLGGFSPWNLGPLAASFALTASGVTLSALPEGLTVLGQLAIGASLGCRFSQDFLKQAPRFLTVALVTSVLGVLATSGFAACMGWASGIPVATLVLATAPGGMAEMSLTARNLQLGVPVVTAFHVIRMAASMSLTGQVYLWIAKRRGWPIKTRPVA
ncbi:MAG: hypothetical protein RLZ51_1045 [Pseudomonadota bacterium]|jgi:membrane AbrB-like protein